MEMTMFLLVWFVLIWTFTATRMLSVVGEDHNNPGFITIDCGTQSESTDAELGLFYEKDDIYTTSGQNQEISKEYWRTKQLSANTLREFPNGTRNCYMIPPTGGSSGSNKYLIRAWFLYGNYDGKNQLPKFELHLGVNLWARVGFSAIDTYIYYEVIHVVASEDTMIQVCLVNTDSGTPFITTLELRPLNDNMYHTNATTLSLYKRLNVGNKTKTEVRYPQDVHDRIWIPDDTSYSPTTKLGSWNYSSDPVLSRDSDSYEVPAAVLRTYTMADSSGNLIINWKTSSTGFSADNWIVYFHFAEMVTLAKPREFTIYTNDQILTKISLEYLKPVTVNSQQFTSDIGFNFKFVPTDATLSPILNAVEVFYLLDLPYTPTALDDVNAMHDIKTKYNVLKESWQGDPCGPPKFLWEGLNCSTEDPPRVFSLDLSSSGLKGDILKSLGNLTELKYLNLSHNELTGSVPDFLAKLENLKVLDLTGNKLRGSVPQDLLRRANVKTLQLSLEENPGLCTSGSCGLSKKMKTVIKIASAAGVTAIVVIFIWIVLGKKQLARRKKGMLVYQNGKPKFRSSEGISGSIAHRNFTFEEVERMTDNFDVKNIIGQGAFGLVFRGKLEDGTEVAVKKLSKTAVEGPKQFETEVKLLLKIHHKNLVWLRGYCDAPGNMALIYEYLPKGNLYDNLSKKDANLLTWEERLRIAVDAAKGLDYLHNDCNPPIVHRDIKTANILLDEHMQAKISDFGLSRIFSSANGNPIPTGPVGTHGYLDPEYRSTKKLTKKSDVYSFGIVLLELVTARPVQNGKHIVDWVAREVKKPDNLKHIVDPKLDGQYDSGSAEKLVAIAMSCTEATAAQRPNIQKVLEDLKACCDPTSDGSPGATFEGRDLSISSYKDAEPLRIDSLSSTDSSYWGRVKGFTTYIWSS